MFKSVGSIIAKGFGNNEYSFTDKSIITYLPQVIYYTIMAVDKDGSISYSAIRNVELGIRNVGISVYPNPAKDVVNIDCAGAKEIVIVNQLGQIIKQLNNITNEHQTLNTKQFKKGLYIVKAMMITGEIKTEKLIVE